MEKAIAEKRVVLTFDLDFGDLLALGIEKEPSVIIFRLHDETPTSVNPRLVHVLENRRSELESGALIIVEDGRYRMRRLPSKNSKGSLLKVVTPRNGSPGRNRHRSVNRMMKGSLERSPITTVEMLGENQIFG